MTEKETFDAVMKKVLSVSKKDLQKQLKAEKKRKLASHGPAASRQNAVSST